MTPTILFEVGEALVKIHFDIGQTALPVAASEQIASVLAALAAAPRASAPDGPGAAASRQ